MPSLWDYLHFNRQYHNKRNLEEGLFQIASQTCNILVKVNNTNNINLTRNNRSDEYGCAGPPKNKSSMQICVPKFRKNSITSGCNPGLSQGPSRVAGSLLGPAPMVAGSRDQNPGGGGGDNAIA